MDKDRLTKKATGGGYTFYFSKGGKVVNKLAAYENSGLSPKEVMELANQLKALKELAYELETDLKQNIREMGACKCDYCANTCKFRDCEDAEFVWSSHAKLHDILGDEYD